MQLGITVAYPLLAWGLALATCYVPSLLGHLLMEFVEFTMSWLIRALDQKIRLVPLQNSRFYVLFSLHPVLDKPVTNFPSIELLNRTAFLLWYNLQQIQGRNLEQNDRSTQQWLLIGYNRLSGYLIKATARTKLIWSCLRIWSMFRSKTQIDHSPRILFDF